jgi:hypothetical protein
MQTLKTQIDQLEAAANDLTGADQNTALNNIILLRNKLTQASLDPTIDQLNTVELPDLTDFTQKIAAANAATAARATQVQAVNDAIKFVAGILKVALA